MTTYNTRHTFDIPAEWLAEDSTALTPMMRQYLAIKNEYTGTLLFYRMGDFYETFFEDALMAARALEITLTHREAGKLGKIPMAGVPVKAVNSYLPRLLEAGFHVAICEQVDTEDKKLMGRRVVRVLSAGTLTDNELIESDESRYLAACLEDKGRWGLAYCDVTTGAFYATELSAQQLASELRRVAPTELVVVGRRVKDPHLKGIRGTEVLTPDGEALKAIGALPDAPLSALEKPSCDQAQARLCQLFDVQTLEGYGLHDRPLACQAAGMIAEHLERHFPEAMPVLDAIRLYQPDTGVILGSRTAESLELMATQRNTSLDGSLLGHFRQTVTPMGSRMLVSWLGRPLTELSEINARLDAVAALVGAPTSLTRVRELLTQMYDAERLATRIANLSASPRDFLALAQTLEQLPELAKTLQPLSGFYLERLHSVPPALVALAASIRQAIADNPAMTLTDGGIIAEGYHPQLDAYRARVATNARWLEDYEAQEREKTGIKTLKIGYNGAFGYFLEVSRGQSDNVPFYFHRKQTLTNAERFTTEALKQHEGEVLEAQQAMATLEYELFTQLRQQLRIYADELKNWAQRLAALDVLGAFAEVACRYGYCRPEVDTSLELDIKAGCHPMVAARLPLGGYVPNDTLLAGRPLPDASPEAAQLQLITGPNMAGKSTYMRQVALIVLMAQMGSFVPARRARIGLVDKLYTRIGAVDDVTAGQSTFMVEMAEVAQILNGATERSLVLLDEVGRGTSTYDGVAVATAIAEYIVGNLGCRTLFSTHYHELTSLAERFAGAIENVCTAVRETEGTIQFLYHVEAGAAQKSYGVAVAKMAGLPRQVIDHADQLLNRLENGHTATPGPRQATRRRASTTEGEPTAAPQLSLF